MNRLDRLALVFLLALLAPAAAGQDTVTGPGWMLDVPAGWKRMPGPELDEIYAEVRKRVPNANFQYVAGFHAADADEAGLPYLLVQITTMPRERVSYDAIEKGLGIGVNQGVKQVQENSGDIFASMDVGQVRLDRDTARVHMKLDVGLHGGKKINGYCVSQITAGDWVQLNLYVDSAKYATDARRMDALLAGLRLDPGHEFEPGASASLVNRVGSGAARGAIIGVSVAIVLGVLGWLRSRKA